ncbi:MAG: phBC6A51 family helix-turn-helix protein [Patescibacteria group bacterium]
MASRKRKSKSQVVETRIAKQKAAMLEMLERLPVIQVACKKVGISKATYYRWYHDDQEFAGLADIAKREGTTTINELAQSKLIELISHSNLSAIIFWLKCRDPEFTEKKHFINEIKHEKPIDPKAKDAVDNIFALFEKKAREVAPQYTVSDDED